MPCAVEMWWFSSIASVMTEVKPRSNQVCTEMCAARSATEVNQSSWSLGGPVRKSHLSTEQGPYSTAVRASPQPPRALRACICYDLLWSAFFICANLRS